MTPMPPSTLIVNARLVNEGREFDGDLRFCNGLIEEIGSGLAARAGETVIDANGRRLLPGMIDDQVHFREPGMEYKADMAIESAAAVAGGLTSFMDMPNTNPPTLNREALEDKYRRADGRCRANYGFYMGASNDNLEDVRTLDPKTAPGIKVFMGASTGNMLVDNPDTLDAIFREAPTPIITHCEDTPTIDANLALFRAKYGDDIPVECHPDIRSREACIKSTRLAIELARRHGTALHVLHISTAEELMLFEPGPVEGKQITAETCVHFLRFARGDYARLGNLIKCNPAIKDASDREALVAALADDVIDVLADLMLTRGAPEHVRSDNGPEFVAKAVREWIANVGAKTAYIAPGSPWENGYNESFNARLRGRHPRAHRPGGGMAGPAAAAARATPPTARPCPCSTTPACGPTAARPCAARRSPSAATSSASRPSPPTP